MVRNYVNIEKKYKNTKTEKKQKNIFLKQKKSKR